MSGDFLVVKMWGRGKRREGGGSRHGRVEARGAGTWSPPQTLIWSKPMSPRLGNPDPENTQLTLEPGGGRGTDPPPSMQSKIGN